MNYEVVPAKIPTNNAEVEQFEKWLEKLSAAGGVLVATMPTKLTDTALCIFTVGKPGALAAFKK